MQYELRVVNESSDVTTVCLYQAMPEEFSSTNIMSTAWFAKRIYPTTHTRFNWDLTYQFMWDETGELKPGIIFDAQQAWNAGLTENNVVTLTCDSDGAFTFKDLTTQQNTTPSLKFELDGSIPPKRASLGIGMSNSPIFVRRAEPYTSLIFTPNPVYWVTFGEYKRGQVLDTSQITNRARILFPQGVYSMTATLDQAHRWWVRPTW